MRPLHPCVECGHRTSEDCSLEARLTPVGARVPCEQCGDRCRSTTTNLPAPTFGSVERPEDLEGNATDEHGEPRGSNGSSVEITPGWRGDSGLAARAQRHRVRPVG